MKISTKGRYGLRILLDLALHAKESPRQMKEIAQSQQISEKYISRLILSLNKAGLIISLQKADYNWQNRPKKSHCWILSKRWKGLFALSNVSRTRLSAKNPATVRPAKYGPP